MSDAAVAKTEQPKTMKVIFVEDIARHICDLVPGTDSMVSELIQMCILKAANVQGAVVCFKYMSDPKDESTAEIVPIYQARVYDANLKVNKNDTHTYNVFAVEAGKNKNSKFVEEAKKKTSSYTVSDFEVVDKKETQLVFATLDMTVHQFHATTERTDALPPGVVVPGDIRLNTDKFEYKRANFYTKMNLPQNYKKQRLVELAEYKLTLELLSRLCLNNKRPNDDELKAMQIVVGDKGEKINVTDTFAQRAGYEIGCVAENLSGRNSNARSYDVKFKRMIKYVADCDPSKFAKEVAIPVKN